MSLICGENRRNKFQNIKENDLSSHRGLWEVGVGTLYKCIFSLATFVLILNPILVISGNGLRICDR